MTSRKTAKVIRRTISADNVAEIDPRCLASSSADAFCSALRVVVAAERSTSVGKTVTDAGAWSGLTDALETCSQMLRQNDLTHVEDMLMGQAVGLQALFVRLTEGAMAAETTITNYDLKLRYALRAQSQCRATLETLATIKNPPMLFARQANVSSGPQQINNGPVTHRSTPSHARENENGQSELSGEGIELPQDTGTPALACRADTPLASMGEIDRTSDGGREGAGVAERMEGRPTRLAAVLGAGPAKAKAVVEPVKARRRGALR
jgi:hypothetical protein